jgi:hypothetical protein
LRQQHVDLPKLRDDLFRLVLLMRHSGILQGSKAYFTEDHFSGGRPQTRATLEGSMLRPRHDGYMAFQSESARVISEGLLAKTRAKCIVEDINRLMRDARAREP